jgi:hypothetical protein
MDTQLGLPIADRLRMALESATKEIRSALRQVAKGTKQGEVLARTIDMDPGNFSRALRGDTYKLDAAESLPAFFEADEEQLLIRLLCRLCGGRFVPDPKVTPEQQLEAYRAACRRSGAAGEAIMRDAGEAP